jgi:hypothetical protein
MQQKTSAWPLPPAREADVALQASCRWDAPKTIAKGRYHAIGGQASHPSRRRHFSALTTFVGRVALSNVRKGGSDEQLS